LAGSNTPFLNIILRPRVNSAAKNKKKHYDYTVLVDRHKKVIQLLTHNLTFLTV